MSDMDDQRQTRAVTMSEQHAAAASRQAEAPEAIEMQMSSTARHGDPSVQRQRTERTTTGGVEWVRASDLLARVGGRTADRAVSGLDRAAAHWRHGMAQPSRDTKRPGRGGPGLPPVAAFGSIPPASPSPSLAVA